MIILSSRHDYVEIFFLLFSFFSSLHSTQQWHHKSYKKWRYIQHTLRISTLNIVFIFGYEYCWDIFVLASEFRCCFPTQLFEPCHDEDWQLAGGSCEQRFSHIHLMKLVNELVISLTVIVLISSINGANVFCLSNFIPHRTSSFHIYVMSHAACYHRHRVVRVYI